MLRAALFLTACSAAALSPRQQPSAPNPSSDEVRPLVWGDLNFLHTTDTHGWLAGHLLENEFSGDWGDFVAFTESMRAIATSNDQDLLLIDTGDRHDGNGLSDATPVNGNLSLPIFCTVDYDVVTVGNHELYTGATALQEYNTVRTHFGDKYIVSNVEVLDNDEWRDLGAKYRLFQTANQNKTILAFGFLFNFEGNDKSYTRVTKVEDEIQKEWFQELLNNLDSVDYIVLAGHIPVRGWPEFRTILNAIRRVNPTIPVHMFGGHSHVRDYVIYDDNAVALQSGRYVETLGWASSNFTSDADAESESGASATFSRSYIDFNRRTMLQHCNCQLKSEKGQSITAEIAKIRSELELDTYLSYVPQTYYMDRAPYPSEDSIYSLLESVLQTLVSPKEVVAKGNTRFVFLNTGAVRFDLFKGPYTKDTTFILSPFRNKWFYIDDVPLEYAEQVLLLLNGYNKVLLQANSRFAGAHYLSDLKNADQSGVSMHAPTFGYVTEDDLDDMGDDTVHRAWLFYDVPNAIQSVTNRRTANTTLVFHNFMQYYILEALSLISESDGSQFEVKAHGGADITELVSDYFNTHNKHNEHHSR